MEKDLFSQDFVNLIPDLKENKKAKEMKEISELYEQEICYEYYDWDIEVNMLKSISTKLIRSDWDVIYFLQAPDQIYQKYPIYEKLLDLSENINQIKFQNEVLSYIRIVKIFQKYFEVIRVKQLVGQDNSINSIDVFDVLFNIKISLEGMNKVQPIIYHQFLKAFSLMIQIKPNNSQIQQFISVTYQIEELQQHYLAVVQLAIYLEITSMHDNQFITMIDGVILRGKKQLEKKLNCQHLNLNHFQCENYIKNIIEMLFSENVTQYYQKIALNYEKFMNFIIQFAGKFRKKLIIKSAVISCLKLKCFNILKNRLIKSIITIYSSLTDFLHLEIICQNKQFLQYYTEQIIKVKQKNPQQKQFLFDFYLDSNQGCIFILKIILEIFGIVSLAKRKLVIGKMTQAAFLSDVKYYIQDQDIRFLLQNLYDNITLNDSYDAQGYFKQQIYHILHDTNIIWGKIRPIKKK